MVTEVVMMESGSVAEDGPNDVSRIITTVTEVETKGSRSLSKKIEVSLEQ